MPKLGEMVDTLPYPGYPPYKMQNSSDLAHSEWNFLSFFYSFSIFFFQLLVLIVGPKNKKGLMPR